MYIIKIEEKVPGKVGECIFDSKKCKSFQGPKVGPGPQLILARFAHLTPLRYVGKISEKISGGPPWPNPGSATAPSVVLTRGGRVPHPRSRWGGTLSLDLARVPPVQVWKGEPHPWLGGTPGYPCLDLARVLPSRSRWGYPISNQGVPQGTPVQTWLGYPLSGPGQGTPIWTWLRYPPSRPGRGTPHPGMDSPPSKAGWGYPPPPSGPDRGNLRPRSGQTENFTFLHPSDAVGN